MTTPKLIIFDWDGTLADTTQPIIDTMRRLPNAVFRRPKRNASAA